MKIINKLKISAIKLFDKLNDRYYPCLPPKNYTFDKPLSEYEADVYEDIKQRIDPSGLFAYRWDVKRQAEGKLYPDLGDRCLFQGLLIGAVAIKGDKEILERLLKGAEYLIDNGCLIRGFSIWHKIKLEGEWMSHKTEYPENPVSGDQLAGLIFGLSFAYHFYPELFFDSMEDKILSLADRMINDRMMLRDGLTGKIHQDKWLSWQGELPYDSWFNLNGTVTTKLAVLSLAKQIKANKLTTEWNKYATEYYKLIEDYDYATLSEYSSIHLDRLWCPLSINRYFGTHISAISLFTIGLNMCFPDYVTRGLERIAWQTRDWGYALYDLLAKFSKNTAFNNSSEDKIKSSLYSYFIEDAEDVFAKDIFGRKIRIRPLSHRAKNYWHYYIENDPYVNANNKNPDLWAWKNSSRLDFFLEYHLAKYLEVI